MVMYNFLESGKKFKVFWCMMMYNFLESGTCIIYTTCVHTCHALGPDNCGFVCCGLLQSLFVFKALMLLESVVC